MVECKDDEAVTNVNSAIGSDSLRIVKGADRHIYISGTDMDKGNQYSTIVHIIYIKIYRRIPFDLLDLEVKPEVDSHVLCTSSVSKSTSILLYWSPELYIHLQFHITAKPITLYTWLFLVPSSKQVVDWEESKMILLITKEVPGTSLITWLFKGYFF